MSANSTRLLPFLVICISILLLSLSRLLPHPPNFTPLMATALFGGRYFSNTIFAFAIPLLALWIGDLFLGFHSLVVPVYGSFIISILLGRFLKNLKKGPTLLNTTGITFLSSLQFFIITNFAVWFSSGIYPQNLSGLSICYINGLPFFANSLLGNFFYMGLFLGSYELLSKKIPILAH